MWKMQKEKSEKILLYLMMRKLEEKSQENINYFYIFPIFLIYLINKNI